MPHYVIKRKGLYLSKKRTYNYTSDESEAVIFKFNSDKEAIENIVLDCYETIHKVEIKDMGEVKE